MKLNWEKLNSNLNSNPNLNFVFGIYKVYYKIEEFMCARTHTQWVFVCLVCVACAARPVYNDAGLWIYAVKVSNLL